MARRSGLLIASVAFHGALAVAIGSIETKKLRAATAITYAEAEKKKPLKPTPIEPLPPEKPSPARAAARRAAPAPLPAPEPPTKVAAPAPIADMPDFGLSLTGGVNGTGIALPSGNGGLAPPRAVEKVFHKPLPVAAVLPNDGCDDPPAKPRPIAVPQPGYTPDAISAAVEGKVRVQVTVDESGRVVDVKLVQGLGHGLDEAALQAARNATFEPALRCGKATRATFSIAMRFSLPK